YYYWDSNISKFNNCYTLCKTCSEGGDSTTHNCSTCITDYYPLSDALTQCYLHTDTIPQYVFKATIFERCYISCETCLDQGDINSHNCSQCKTGYYKRSDDSKMCHQSTEILDNYLFDNPN